jgi:hypothetical protein
MLTFGLKDSTALQKKAAAVMELLRRGIDKAVLGIVRQRPRHK